jgi:hypothetical protein
MTIAERIRSTRQGKLSQNELTDKSGVNLKSLKFEVIQELSGESRPFLGYGNS